MAGGERVQKLVGSTASGVTWKELTGKEKPVQAGTSPGQPLPDGTV